MKQFTERELKELKEDERKEGFAEGFLLATLIAVILGAAFWPSKAKAQEAPAQGWVYMGDTRAPITLKQCAGNAKATISMNVGTGWPWRSFCYYGPHPRGNRKRGQS